MGTQFTRFSLTLTVLGAFLLSGCIVHRHGRSRGYSRHNHGHRHKKHKRRHIQESHAPMTAPATGTPSSSPLR